MSRDQYLTVEVLGGCWHEPKDSIESIGWLKVGGAVWCKHCHEPMPWLNKPMKSKQNNFSTWEGFGKLWGFCQKQEWAPELHRKIWSGYCGMKRLTLTNELTNPDRFADAVYEFHKSLQKKQPAPRE